MTLSKVYNPKNVEEKGRLQPGKMFLVNTEEGRIIPDEEIKQVYASKYNYQEWIKNNIVKLNNIIYTL